MRSAERRTASATSAWGGFSGVSFSASARPTRAASGVRRSWETAVSSELRRRSLSICSVLCCATSM
jgi:hypothetical protein